MVSDQRSRNCAPYATLCAACPTVLFCAAVAFSLAFFDLLVAAYIGPWLGGTRAEWASWRVVLLAYAGGIAALGACWFLMLRLILRRVRASTTAYAAMALAGMSIAIIVASALDTLPRWVVGAFVSLPILLLAYMLSARRSFGAARAAALLLVSLLSGLVTVRAAYSLLFIVRDTSATVTLVGVFDFVLVLVMLTVLMALTSRSGAGQAGRLAAAMLVAGGPPVLLWAWPQLAQTLGPPNRAMNIVLITADALRKDYLSAFGGHVPTPNLERLARRGVRFDSCYSTAPWTIPSLNAMFSTRYPPGLTPHADPTQREREQLRYQELASYWLEADGSGIVSQLSRRGYDTAAFCGNGAMREQRWLFEQFDQAVVIDSMFAWGATKLPLNPIVDRFVHIFFPELIQPMPMDITAEATQFATRYLALRRNETFFLWVHFLDPHTPYDPPERFRDERAPKTGRYLGDGASAGISRRLSQEEARALYEGEIRYLDESIGRILDAIESNDLMDDTVVAFCADHGEELWDRGKLGHGHTMYNEVVGVPLIVAGPTIEPRIIREPVSTISVLPTLLDVANVPGPVTGGRLSLEAALHGRPCELLSAPCFATATHELYPPTEPKQMIRDGRYKFVRWLISGKRLLFDQQNDPREIENLADARPDIATALEAKLNAWEESYPAHYSVAQQMMLGRFSGAPPSVELHQNLEALGYL